MNAIKIKNLKKSYRSSDFAVDDLSLTIPKSSVFGILGPNGAGKSTILNILAGIVKKTAGEIVIFGERIKNDAYEYKRKIGFVLEQPHYLEKLNVIEYLHFVGAMYEIDVAEIKKRTKELINFFDLDKKKNSWIETYSKGMKKKVSLAAAMIHQPELLVLDEPLEGIDPTSAKQIKDNLSLMAKKGVTVLVTSHNLDTIERFCDEVAIINKGKLVFQARTGEIQNKIKNEVNNETYNSLEEIFIDVVSENSEQQSQKLSWL
jgi:ABC-2 type transport system ATP-binding protein